MSHLNMSYKYSKKDISLNLKHFSCIFSYLSFNLWVKFLLKRKESNKNIN